MSALRAAVHRGCSFLDERQGEDGTWRDFITLAGEAVEWTTAYAAYQIRLTRTLSSPSLGRAVAALRSRQREDGGWGFHRNVPTDADSSAFALAVLASIDDVPRVSVERGAACLLTHQCADGGFATYRHPDDIRRFLRLPSHVSLRGWCQPCAEVTAAAGIALLRADGAHERSINGAWSYLASTQEDDGAWPAYWWSSPHYATCLGITFATELQARKVDVGGVLAQATRWVVRSSGPHTSTFALATVVGALARAAPASSELELLARELVCRQRSDGGWQSDPILCIPWPARAKHHDHVRWAVDQLGVDVIVRDQNRSFTTATCVGALALADEVL